MQTDWRDFLGQLPQLRIAVVGDVMLDRYLFGDVTRISPEAPVPVHAVRQRDDRPGGAANVAANLCGAGCRVFLFGRLGNDAEGRDLERLLQRIGQDTRGLVTTETVPTTTKMRIIGARQQMVRIDFERAEMIAAEVRQELLERLRACLSEGIDALVLSDYGKGVCSPELCHGVIALAETYGVPVLVDPKGTDWQKYAGAAVLTPNVKELSEVAGSAVANTDAAVTAAGREVLAHVAVGALAVTRSERGITLLRADGGSAHAPATAREVFDVSGAGDTAVALLAAGLAARLPEQRMLHLANRAAGYVVGKVGTYAITKRDLLEALGDEVPAERYLLTSAELAEQLAAWRAAGKRIVFTNGCFDILHRGHISYLQQAAALGDVLLVGLNSDASVRRLKGPERPLRTAEDRAYMLAALRAVTAVVEFTEDTPAELLAQVRPDVLVKGGDYRVEELAGREYAGETVILPYVEGYSTTGLVETIRGKGENIG